MQGRGVRVTYPPSREGAAPKTVPLEDLALSDRESVFHAPRAGDVALLGVLVVVLVGCGAWIWRQLGVNSEGGRAFFFGLLLICVYWCVLVYTLKLSLSVRVSPRSVSVGRGPWRVEIRWIELTRLMERMQTLDGRRYRWVIALARDGRRISVREDGIGDYARFRREVYERYRLWRDHGGTWGATGSGPFIAREMVRDEAQWWAVGALMIALPGLYFTLLLPETNPLGYALLACAVACLVMLARAFLLRQTYTIERPYIETRSALKRTRLTWGEITKVERTRHPVGGIILAVVALGRLTLRLASRSDTGIRSFAWSPRVPEYLILRGGGRQARIKLHRLMQPDELLAWIEFYDQVRRSSAASRTRPVSGPLSQPLAGARATSGPSSGPQSGPLSGPITARTSAGPAPTAARSVTSGPISSPNLTPDMSGASGPLDPWGAGRQGEPTISQPIAPRTLKTPFVAPRPPTTPRLPDLPSVAAEETPAVFDLPTARPHATGHAASHSASQDDAWLRETNAQPSVGGAQFQDHFQPSAATPEPWGQPGAAQHVPMPPPTIPHAPPGPPPWETNQRWDANPPAHHDRRQDDHVEQAEQVEPATSFEPFDEQFPDEFEAPADEMESEPRAPWHEEGWQPPILPRFGPQRDEDSRQR